MSGEAAARTFAAREHGVFVGGEEHVTLELGGKNPNVVFADADLDAAIEGALSGAFENAGQACIAGSRLLVERSAHDELVARVAERAQALRVGPGWEDGIKLGPLVSAAQRERVIGYVRGAGAPANDTRYGLAAAVWTRDGARALSVARRIRAGTVWVNAYGSIRPEVPFGGFGQSGFGRELGAHGLAEYTEPKSLFLSV
jgi:acyl-CoA reductase-like NAD-dependent aldehyde dehydrogenase